jgi:long-chain acyl-CoA synthetase
MSAAMAAGLRPLAEVDAELTGPGQPFEMEVAQVGAIPLRVWKRTPRCTADLVEEMRKYGERPYLVYEDERLSYAEAYARIATLARHLQGELGVRKGDRVAIALRNYPEWPIAFFAGLSIGAIVVPINAWWKGEEIAYGLADSGSSVLFADEERARLLEPQLSKLELRHCIAVRAGSRTPARWLPLEVLLGPAAGAQLPRVAVEPDDDATIFYTSGTTGQPKGALGSHRNLLTMIVSGAFARARARLRQGEALPDPAVPAPPSSQLVSVPFFHVTGSHSVLTASTAFGNKLVLMYRWNPERALELIERERIEVFGGVPSMVWQVLESPEFARRDTSSVTGIGYGGAPAAPELARRIERAFPPVVASNGYGMTETSAMSTANSGFDYLRKPDSIGRPVAVVDVKVVDADGRTLPPGEIGELCIRGPNIVKGYWNKPQATAATFRDGWCHSGDIARIDDEGFVYIVDRAKDMVIRAGENVYCVEVEDALYSHGAVMDAAVVGLPHRVLGEEVAAVVQIAPHAYASEEELRKHVAERLAGFKVPVHIELRREPLPRNENGKILKRRLRDELVQTLSGGR